MQPFILTLKLDSDSFERLNALRRAHFPTQRNHLSAHLTLFHALPAAQESLVREVLAEAAAHTAILPLHFTKPRFLGKGVAIEVEAEHLEALRRELSAKFRDFLTPQDAQTIRPHVTVQNKVTPEAARQLFNTMTRDWKPWQGSGEGFSLWRYLGGPWEGVGEFMFESEK